MIQIDLKKDEREILSAVLENHFSDLRMEIANTGRMDYRTMLKQRKEVVKKVLKQLQASAMT